MIRGARCYPSALWFRGAAGHSTAFCALARVIWVTGRQFQRSSGLTTAIKGAYQQLTGMPGTLNS